MNMLHKTKYRLRLLHPVCLSNLLYMLGHVERSTRYRQSNRDRSLEEFGDVPIFPDAFDLDSPVNRMFTSIVSRLGL